MDKKFTELIADKLTRFIAGKPETTLLEDTLITVCVLSAVCSTLAVAISIVAILS